MELFVDSRPSGEASRGLTARRLLLLSAFTGFASMVGIGLATADADHGKGKAESCVACHGDTGISKTESIPSLASQPDSFLQWQLVFFRSGARKNEIMEPIAGALSNEDIRDLGAYFASLKPADASVKMPDDHPDLTDAGKRAAANGRCASCHGDDYAGSKAAARIAGQREEYIVKALHDYKSGVRTGGGVAAMAEVAYPLSDQDITALAHYLSHL